MEQCTKKYAGIKNIPKAVEDIEKFCVLLRANKVKDSKEAFLKLPLLVQCIFLHHAWTILSKKVKYTDESYLTAFYIFKLFRSKELKEKEIYQKYGKLKTLEKLYKSALEWSKASPKISTGKTASKSPQKKYDKEYQKYEEPKDVLDPLYVYYTSLYEEDPASRLAITWLTEHGLFENAEREKIVKLYKKLLEKGKLIK